jgi:hypothetical protein
MRAILLDTGPLVALIDKSERNHKACLEFLKTYSGNILTTEPVITEALYLLNIRFSFQKTCIDFILQAEIEIIPQTKKSLQRAIKLMDKYQDIPMDYADATLVGISEETGIKEIFTLDKRGFTAYKFNRNKSFKIFP